MDAEIDSCYDEAKGQEEANRRHCLWWGGVVEVLLVWAGVEPAPLRTSPLFPLEMRVFSCA